MANFTYWMQAALVVCLFVQAKSEVEKRSSGNEALQDLRDTRSLEELLTKRGNRHDDDDRFFDVEEKRYFPGEQKRYFPGEQKRYFPGGMDEKKRFFPGGMPPSEALDEKKRFFPGGMPPSEALEEKKRFFPGGMPPSEALDEKKRFFPGGMPPLRKRMPMNRNVERSPEVYWDSNAVEKRERFLGRRNSYDERETTP